MGMTSLSSSRRTPAEEAWHIRRPDYHEERGELTLQIWGDEGYWHIVDREIQELLEAVRQPTTQEDLLTKRPEWARQKDLVTGTLQSVRRGLTHAAKSTATQIENVSVNLTTACTLRCGQAEAGQMG